MRARVAIVGAGSAGLAMAAALRGAGAEVVLIDRMPRDRIAADVGGAYELTAGTLEILDELGAGEQVRRRGTSLRRFELRACSGRRLQRLDFEAAGFEIFSITRSELQRALWERALALGCTILGGAGVDAVVEEPDRVVLALASGARVEADLLVGADGVHSVVRRRLFDPAPPEPVGLRAWWGTSGADAGPLELEAGHSLGLVGPGCSIVLANAGRAGEPRLLWTVCARDDAGDGAPDLAGVASAFPAQVQALIARTAGARATRILGQRPLARWGTHRALLIGDAAHGMAPFLGLGANSAIEDAAVFARALAGARALPEAVHAIARARARALNPRIGEARRLGRLMHARHRFTHALFRALTWSIPPALVLRQLRARHARRPPPISNEAAARSADRAARRATPARP